MDLCICQSDASLGNPAKLEDLVYCFINPLYIATSSLGLEENQGKLSAEVSTLCLSDAGAWHASLALSNVELMTCMQPALGNTDCLSGLTDTCM